MPRPTTQSSNPNLSLKWNILLTSVGLLLITGLLCLPFLAGPPREDELPDIIQFIGRFHPVVLHLPIGILVWVMVLEGGHLFRRNSPPSSSRGPMGCVAATAAAASLLGFLLYHSLPEYDKELAQRHLFGGILFSCMAITTFLVKLWVDAAGGRRNVIYQIFLLVTVYLMGAASHDGASLTHGKGYLTDHAPEFLRKLLGLPKNQSFESPPSVRDGENQQVYNDIIVPILEQKCYSCHNAEKQKGQFRIDQYELLLKGGKESVALIPGNPATSNIIVRIDLPEDNHKHMPPQGRKDFDAHELVLLKWWITQGASKDATFADLNATDEIKEALSKLAKAKNTESAPKTNVKLNDALKNQIDSLRREFPSSLNYEFQDSDTLTFTALNMRRKFGDEQLAKLESVFSIIVSLDISHSAITDEGLKKLTSATRLKSLRLAETQVGDASMITLSQLSGLESLNLYGTQVTNKGILKLSNLQKLKKLYLWQTNVDPNTLQVLQKKLPQCQIITGI